VGKRVLVLGLVLFLAFCGIALAISNPDAISIGSVAVFEDVVEPGDQLFFVRYDVSYSSEPSEDVEDAFLMAIYNPDGTTTGYTRPLNYYQHNIISIYLTPSQALTWGSAYRVRVMGNPGLFSPLTEGTNMFTKILGVDDYKGIELLGGYLIEQAKDLQTDWGITLLTSGDLLNTTGAMYFNKAIPGIYNIVPDIFQVSSSFPSINVTTNWTTEGEDLWLEHKGPALNAAMVDIADWLGTSPNWIGIGITSMLAMIFGSTVYAITKNPGYSLVFSTLTLPLAAWGGLLEMTIWIVVFMVVAVIFGIIFIQGRFT